MDLERRAVLRYAFAISVLEMLIDVDTCSDTGQDGIPWRFDLRADGMRCPILKSVKNIIGQVLKLAP